MSAEENRSDQVSEDAADQDIPESTDEKEQAIQRRFARIEEALGLSPFT
ncbi:hypothetical protein N7613_14005 [Pseudomonas juntendi]|jgi:hypothetical protein|nr:hypothetical protein [Pseudomonas juntendi]MBI6916550.1 hypothetical protein [Pseudomonas juntendi]MDG9809743.1 hypothetical protein [Pseudomonas juntendi]